MRKGYDGKSDAKYLKDSTALIEMTLEAFGIAVRVIEVSTFPAFYEYHLEVAVGVDLNKLEKRDRDLALALGSPTGKVEWQIPVPGKTYVALRVPKPSPEIYHEERMSLNVKGWRSKIASAFYVLGEVCFMMGRKVLGY